MKRLVRDPRLRKMDREFENMHDVMNRAKDLDQMVVGHGINLATQGFQSVHSDMRAFLDIDEASQWDYVTKLSDVTEKLRETEPHVSIGFRMFSLWIVAHILQDISLMEKVSPELSRLSKKADMLTAALEPID